MATRQLGPGQGSRPGQGSPPRGREKDSLILAGVALRTLHAMEFSCHS